MKELNLVQQLRSILAMEQEHVMVLIQPLTKLPLNQQIKIFYAKVL